MIYTHSSSLSAHQPEWANVQLLQLLAAGAVWVRTLCQTQLVQTWKVLVAPAQVCRLFLSTVASITNMTMLNVSTVNA